MCVELRDSADCIFVIVIFVIITIVIIIMIISLAGGHRGPQTRENVPAGLWWCTWAHLSRSWWPP